MTKFRVQKATKLLFILFNSDEYAGGPTDVVDVKTTSKLHQRNALTDYEVSMPALANTNDSLIRAIMN